MLRTAFRPGPSSTRAAPQMVKASLYFIDLPNQDLRSYNPGEYSSGIRMVVPDLLRQRWELRLGPSQELLPKLIMELVPIDIFFHDSDHSYARICFEFRAVYQAVKKNGLILSDDVHKEYFVHGVCCRERHPGNTVRDEGGAAVKNKD